MSPRTYQLGQRQAAIDDTRERIITAARGLLLSENFSSFTMEAVARAADVSRLTVYYQFDSKAGLLEALYDHLARNGALTEIPDVFREGNEPLQKLARLIEVFARFWASDRDVIRRLHALGALDAEIGKGLRARNERRRNALRVLVDLYCRAYLHQFIPAEEQNAIDTLHMLTSFETYDALRTGERSLDDVVQILRKHALHAIGFTPRVGPSHLHPPPTVPPTRRRPRS